MTDSQEPQDENLPPDKSATRCGFVALIGAPNAGKSTLLNMLVGSKVSIVTHKVQTTRSLVRGIATEADSQIVFIDTPGIFNPGRRLERAMVAAAWGGAEEADIVALLHDVQKPADHAGTARIMEGLKARGGGAILILNKIDQVLPARLLEQAAQFQSSGLFDEIFMVSALSGDGVADFRRFLAGRMPEGPWHYPEDQLSDLPLRLLAAEITREKLFLQLHQELPYALTVESEDWQNFENGDVRIAQVIYVQRPQHKAMCLGKSGQKIKLVRESAQKDLAEALDCRVHLFLHVKVREKWLDDPDRYHDWGLNFEA